MVASSPPANVSILIEATDVDGDPVPNILTDGEIQLFEDGQLVSPFESRQRIQPIGLRVGFPTLLLLDLSGSIIGSGNLENLKASANQFVATLLDPATPNAEAREIAVAFFPGDSQGRGIQLVSDFSSDTAAIQARIDSILGAPDTTTNLNEAILEGLGVLEMREQELLDTTEIEIVEGSLAVFTDGTDRAGTVATQDVLDALDVADQQVFTIGLDGEIDQTVLQMFGRSGFVLVDNIANLSTTFAQVAETIQASANRFYAVEYCSPKRGGTHELQVVATLNGLIGSTTATFVADGFRAGCRVPEAAAGLTGLGGAVLDDIAYDAATDGFVVGGAIGSDANWFGRTLSANGGSDAFLSVVNPPTGDGVPASETLSVVFSGPGNARIRTVSSNGQGGYLAVGEFQQSLDAGGLALTGNGVAPTTFVASIDGTGAVLWARALSGSDEQRPVAVIETVDTVRVAGHFRGELNCDGMSGTAQDLDLFVIDLNRANGACTGLITGGGEGDQRLTAFTRSPNGTAALSGQFTSSMQFGGQTLTTTGSDEFVMLWNTDDSVRWLRSVPVASVTSLTFDVDQDVVLGGEVDGNLQVDALTAADAGAARDGYILSLASNDGTAQNGQVLGDSTGTFTTAVTDLTRDGLGNLYAATNRVDAGSGSALVGFSVFLPSGALQLSYLYATDLGSPVRFALGPLGLDRAAIVGSFAREAGFGPFPLRYDEPAAPQAPFSGRQAFVGLIGPRS
ncbi:MAG: hypothetical protein AAF196_02450 [Planctomycetota bacterium]